jgi:hypothetical protein
MITTPPKLLNLAAAITLLAAAASVAHAQQATSFIKTGGNDDNPCTAAQPCQSFDGAMAKTDAGGQVVALDSGVYASTTVTKAMTLAAAPGAFVVVAGTNDAHAVQINAGADDAVILSGLTIAWQQPLEAPVNSGVNFDSGLALHVESCAVAGFNRGLDFTPSSSATTSALFVSDTTFRNNVTGVEVAGSARATLLRSQIERSKANGVRVANGAKATARETSAARNKLAGFHVEGSAAELTLVSSVSTHNETGVLLAGNFTSTKVRLTGTAVTNNTLFGLRTTEQNGTVKFSSQATNIIAGNGTNVAAPVEMVMWK